MVNVNQPIQPYRDDEVNNDERFLKKARDKIPNRNFSDVAEQIDERRLTEEEIKKKKLGRKPLPRKAEREKERGDENQPLLSPFDLAKSSGKRKADDDDNLSLGTSAKKRAPIKDVRPFDMHETKDNSQFMRERPDLSYVNPLAQAAPTLSATLTGESTKATAAQSLQEIIDQIVKEVYTLEKNGQTDTIISLKGPLFDQAHLILSGFDTAHKEFNITFDNLTQSGKNLLEMNQNALIEDLSKKGYVVHMVITTTTVETPQIDSSQLSFSRDQREDQGQREEQQKKRQNENT